MYSAKPRRGLKGVVDRFRRGRAHRRLGRALYKNFRRGGSFTETHDGLMRMKGIGKGFLRKRRLIRKARKMEKIYGRSAVVFANRGDHQSATWVLDNLKSAQMNRRGQVNRHYRRMVGNSKSAAFHQLFGAKDSGAQKYLLGSALPKYAELSGKTTVSRKMGRRLNRIAKNLGDPSLLLKPTEHRRAGSGSQKRFRVFPGVKNGLRALGQAFNRSYQFDKPRTVEQLFPGGME